MFRKILGNKKNRIARDICAAHLIGRRRCVHLVRGLKRRITRLAGLVC